MLTLKFRKPIIYKDTPGKNGFKFSFKIYQEFTKLDKINEIFLGKVDICESEMREMFLSQSTPMIVKEEFFPEDKQDTTLYNK